MKHYSEILSRHPYLPAIFSALVILVTAVGIYWMDRNEASVEKVATTEEKMATVTNPFETVSISAKAAYVYDALTGEELFSKNAEAQLPLASITKLMTAVVSSEYIPQNTDITIAALDLAPSGDSGFVVGESWPFERLLSFTLLISSNDGAAALANAAGGYARATTELSSASNIDYFVTLMNRKAAELGLSQSYFLNPTGLDTTGYVSGGYGSARDAGELLRYAIMHAPQAFESTRNAVEIHRSPQGDEYLLENTNEIADRIPGLIASKTGFTDLAGGNLVVAFDAGPRHPIIISVLGSTKEERFSDVETLVAASLEAIQKQ